MKFQEKLQIQRKKNNLSQEQLAEKLSVSRQSVSKWESGESYPDIARLIEISRVLNCTLPEIMDDGTFDSATISNDSKEDLDSYKDYLNDFLNYVTKAYNMFVHMSFSSKLSCLFEMCFIGFILFLFGVIISEFLGGFLRPILQYLPDNIYYLSFTLFTKAIDLVLFVVAIIIFFHLFKIRYLDYYPTIIDGTVKEQTTEELIGENKNAIGEKTKETKLVIRDPKHSSSKFFDVLAKLLSLIFKGLVLLMFFFPSAVCLLMGVGGAVFCLFELTYGILYMFGAIGCIGFSLLSALISVFFFNLVFNRKQPYLILIITFIISLILMGSSIGLIVGHISQMNVVKMKVENTNSRTIALNGEEIESLNFNLKDDNITVKVVEEENILRIKLDYPEKEDYFEHVFNTEENKKNYSYYFRGKDFSFLDYFKLFNEGLRSGEIISPDSIIDNTKVEIEISKDYLEKIEIYPHPYLIEEKSPTD